MPLPSTFIQMNWPRQHQHHDYIIARALSSYCDRNMSSSFPTLLRFLWPACSDKMRSKWSSGGAKSKVLAGRSWLPPTPTSRLISPSTLDTLQYIWVYLAALCLFECFWLLPTPRIGMSVRPCHWNVFCCRKVLNTIETYLAWFEYSIFECQLYWNSSGFCDVLGTNPRNLINDLHHSNVFNSNINNIGIHLASGLYAQIFECFCCATLNVFHLYDLNVFHLHHLSVFHFHHLNVSYFHH